MAQDDIQGQVVDAQGNPVDGAIVELTKSYQSSPDSRGNVFRTTTDSNGNYIFTGHQEGDGTTQEWHVSCYNHDGTAYVNSFNNPGVTADLPSNAIPDSGVFRYRFEDDTDTTAAIDVWNNNNASMSGVFYTTSPLIEGSFSISRDDVDDVINAGNVYETPETGYSVRIPFVWDSTQTHTKPALISAGTGGGTFTTLFRYNDQDNVFEVFHENDGPLSASQSLNDGQEYEAVVTYDSSELVIYLDGNAIGSNTSFGGMSSTTQEWRIGERIDINDDQLNSVMDDIRLYDKSLTATEVSNLYNTGSING